MHVSLLLHPSAIAGLGLKGQCSYGLVSEGRTLDHLIEVLNSMPGG